MSSASSAPQELSLSSSGSKSRLSSDESDYEKNRKHEKRQRTRGRSRTRRSAGKKRRRRSSSSDCRTSNSSSSSTDESSSTHSKSSSEVEPGIEQKEKHGNVSSSKALRERGRSRKRRNDKKRSRCSSSSPGRRRIKKSSKTKKSKNSKKKQRQDRSTHSKKTSKSPEKTEKSAWDRNVHNETIAAPGSGETSSDVKKVSEKLWSVRATNSPMYKFLNASSNMTTKDLMRKVANLFSVKQHLISLSSEFQPSPGNEKMTIEIEEEDEESFQHALRILPNYSKITVQTSFTKMKEVAISDGRRSAISKEAIGEEIKREMGLHNDEGKATKNYLDAKWTDRCDKLMEEDTRFLFAFDKFQAGVELAWGDKRFLLNPFQMICPICGSVKCLGNMNQPSAMKTHITTQHQTETGKVCVKRLKAWIQNHFLSKEQMDKEASLPEGLFNPTVLVSSSRVRAAVLARDIV